jgi:hypothetical protein
MDWNRTPIEPVAQVKNRPMNSEFAKCAQV